MQANAPVSEQILLVLCGVVGSGKTTLAKAIVTGLPGWARVNQDDLGSREACETMARSYLAQGLNVVLDRQNFDVQQRKTWIELGRRFPGVSVRCMVMGTTEEECYERLLLRKNHPTISSPQLATELLDQFISLWVEPRLQEGFDHLLALPSLPDGPLLDTPLLSSLLLSLAQSPRGRQKRQAGRILSPPGSQPHGQSLLASTGGNSRPSATVQTAWGLGAPHDWGSGGRTLGGPATGNNTL